MFALPTMYTPRSRAIARHAASFFAGARVLAKYSEPAVVTTPSISMLSLTANLICPRSDFAGQCAMKARLPGKRALTRGTTEQPLRRSKQRSGKEMNS